MNNFASQIRIEHYSLLSSIFICTTISCPHMIIIFNLSILLDPLIKSSNNQLALRRYQIHRNDGQLSSGTIFSLLLVWYKSRTPQYMCPTHNYHDFHIPAYLGVKTLLQYFLPYLARIFYNDMRVCVLARSWLNKYWLLCGPTHMCKCTHTWCSFLSTLCVI